MDKNELEKLLKEDLKLEKEIIAVKALKKIPNNIPQYGGVSPLGVCSLIGEIQSTKKAFYVTTENVRCTEGLMAVGACEKLSDEEHIKVIEEIIRDFPYHRDVKTAKKYYDGLDEFFLFPKEKNSALLMGPLNSMEDPDLVLLFLTPKSADILNRAHAYLGEFIRGFGGTGGCIFTIRYPFVTGEPTFTTSDLAWRTFAGLNENELTYVYPYGRLQKISEEIHHVAEYVNSFSSW